MPGLISGPQMAAMRATVESNFDKSGVRRRFPMITDAFNDQIRDTAHPDDLAIPNLQLTQETAGESRADRDEQTSDWYARVPFGTDITGRDQLIVGALTFEVIGPPVDFGTHLRARLRYIEG